MIDEYSLERYEQEQCDYGKVLRGRIDWKEGVFKQDSCKRCAFLNNDNLCDMYQNLGEESLCVTCTNYPRHIEEFENLREITLAISCPEVAHIILSQKEPVSFWEEEIESEEEEFEDFDPFFFSYLEDGRQVALKILQNRGLHIFERFSLLKTFAEEMQDIIENAELFDLVDIFEKYEDAEFLSVASKSIQNEKERFYKNAGEAFSYSKSMFSKLYELEHLSDEWDGYLEQCWDTLYAKKAQGYVTMHQAFEEWYNEELVHTEFDLEVILEQLLVYFVFTYFCGAVYDDNVLGKVNMSLVSVHNIYEMFVAMWIRQGQQLSQKDMERIVYRYSRELEHSDVNLELLEELGC